MLARFWHVAFGEDVAYAKPVRQAVENSTLIAVSFKLSLLGDQLLTCLENGLCFGTAEQFLRLAMGEEL